MTKRQGIIYTAVILAVILSLTILWGNRLISITKGNEPTPSRLVPTLNSTPDALEVKARSDLKVFTDWLKNNHVKGYIGEVGWPDNQYGDSAKWNALANLWYRDADVANLWVTDWATGEWWGTSYPLAAYERQAGSSAVNSPNDQAQVIEQHLSTNNYLRGVNVAGGEFGTGSGFSNLTPGSYQYNYHYDSQATFNYLASRKVKLVRIPFRWERIQPNLGQALNVQELDRLKQVIGEANQAGLMVDLDMHNFGGYLISRNGKISRLNIGSADLPDNLYADVWRRLSLHFKDNPKVYYGLMNEPEGLQPENNLSPAKVWEKASQTALTAIRANHDNKLIFVSGYNFSGVATWTQNHPTAWILDPANNYRYEAHQYFDRTRTGYYQNSYADELNWAIEAGYKGQ